MSNLQLLEVVDRGSETQLQVGENLNKLTKDTFQIVGTYLKTRTLRPHTMGMTRLAFTNDRKVSEVGGC